MSIINTVLDDLGAEPQGPGDVSIAFPTGLCQDSQNIKIYIIQVGLHDFASDHTRLAIRLANKIIMSEMRNLGWNRNLFLFNVISHASQCRIQHAFKLIHALGPYGNSQVPVSIILTDPTYICVANEVVDDAFVILRIEVAEAKKIRW